MIQTTTSISDSVFLFSNLRTWLSTPSQGTAPPQGTTKQLIFKGLVSQFEMFDVIAGAQGLFPLQWLFSGLITAGNGGGELTGTGALFEVQQSFSDVNWLDLNDPFPQNLTRGSVTLDLIPGRGTLPPSVRLQMAELDATFTSGWGNTLSATLIGSARDTFGSNAMISIACLEVPATL